MTDPFDPEDMIGAELPPTEVVVERGPVSNFATAVTDDNPVYHDAEAAAEAGFDAIPAPPTWSFAMRNWGAFPEIQPEDADADSPVNEALGALLSEGGLVLHGEEEFVYHRPVVVGDRLTGEGEIVDAYTKEGSATMTFLVAETEWTDRDDEPVVTERMTLLHRA